MKRTVIAALVSSGLCGAGCFYLLPSRGGGETAMDLARVVDAEDVAVPSGYRVEPVASGLTFPSGAVFDDEGRLYVIETGYSYGPAFGTPRLLRVDSDGTTTEIARGDDPPWFGAAFHDGAFYLSANGASGGAKILRVGKDGTKTVVVAGLPGHGDHHTNAPVLGPDGLLYFGQGVTTNAGVVGIDNYEFGWLEKRPALHDIPCEDIALTGETFRTKNPLTPDPDDEAVTGAYQAFGVAGEAGQVVKGQVPCTGSLLRVSPSGGDVELVAWGFRNPWGVAFSPDGRLFVTDNGYDERGSRPVFGGADLLWDVTPGAWYGWPDYGGGIPLATQRFDQLRIPRPKPLLVERNVEVPRPSARFAVHSSSNGIAFSTSEAFGFVGQAFVAQLGDMAPDVGKTLSPVGYRVVRVDPETGVIVPFALNRAKLGPASLVGGGGLERPIDVVFSPDGATLYVVDFGVMTMGEDGPRPQPGTGVVWAIHGPGAQLARSR